MSFKNILSVVLLAAFATSNVHAWWGSSEAKAEEIAQSAPADAKVENTSCIQSLKNGAKNSVSWVGSKAVAAKNKTVGGAKTVFVDAPCNAVSLIWNNKKASTAIIAASAALVGFGYWLRDAQDENADEDFDDLD